MDNRHEIRTIDDILRVVTSENKEDFLRDFRAFLDLSIGIDGLAGAVGAKTAHKLFTWIDDGKHNITVNIQPVPPKELT